LQIEADSAEAAKATADTAAKQLLANQVMESYDITIL
jgi:phosphoribosylformylglycinamidine (FGAM) synthase PurS component